MHLLARLFHTRISFFSALILIIALIGSSMSWSLVPTKSQNSMTQDFPATIQLKCPYESSYATTKQSEMRIFSSCRSDISSIKNLRNHFQAHLDQDKIHTSIATDRIPLEPGENLIEIQFQSEAKVVIKMTRNPSDGFRTIASQ